VTVKKLFISAMIAAFSVVGVVPFASVVGSSSAYAASKVKKKQGYTAQPAGKKKAKMKKASPNM